MSLQYLFDPNTQFQSRGGVNEVGGFLRVFFNGTDDRATTYCNFDGGMNEPDIVLDTDGRAVVIVDDTKTYRLEVYNRFGGLMWTVTNYKARGGGGGGSGTPVSVEGTVDEIDVTENSEGGIKHFIVSLSQVIKNTIATIQSSMSYIASAVNGKKDKQTAASYVGSATQTLVGVTQDENGEINAVFDDIEFPDYSQRFENIENEQTVDAKVIAAALNDLNARLDTLESEGDNIGDVTADSLDAQKLFIGGIPVKFQQTVKSLDGATDKTVTNVSQNENGEITITYSAISFPDWTSAIAAATDLCEKLANKKTTFTGNTSSDMYYPTIKAVVDYLDDRLQNLGGKLITDNGDPFASESVLPSTTPFQGQNILTGDYAYVQNSGLAARYTFTVNGSVVTWTKEYEISFPVFTAAQQNAIDSGITSGKVSGYDSHVADTDIHVTASQKTEWSGKQNALTTAQMNAVNSGITSGKVSGYDSHVADTDIHVTTAEKETWDAKQNAIADLSDIRDGASKGETAVQPEDLATYMTNPVEGGVIAAALNDLNARLEALEYEGDNIGDKIADKFDAQILRCGGVDVKTKQAAKASPSASGTSLSFIDSVSQDSNGEITATKKEIQSASVSQPGVVQLDSTVVSTSTTKAATPSAVKAAYDLANGKQNPIGIDSSSGNESLFLTQKGSWLPTPNEIVLVDRTCDFASVLALVNAGKTPVFQASYTLRCGMVYKGTTSFVFAGVDVSLSYDGYAGYGKCPYIETYMLTSSGWSYESINVVPDHFVKNSIYSSSDKGIPNIKAVVDYIDRAISGIGGKQITNNGSPFTSSASLPSSTPYSGQNIVSNDYAYVQQSYTVTRYVASVSGSSVTWSESFSIDTSSFLTVPIDFTEAQTVENINANETLPTILGKIKKWFTDKISQLGNLAFLNQVGNAQISGTINDSHISSASTWNNKQNALPYSGGKYGISISGSSYSVSKTSLGQVNTLPVASMISSDFKAGTFFLKATADGGSAYSFGDITIPNNQWYRFTVNGESSNYCVITLEIVAGSASSAFGTFKLLVDSGSVKKVVRVPYATKTAAVGSVTTPVYVDDNGEFKESTSVAQKASSGSGNLAVIDGNGNYSSSGISAYNQTMLNGLTSRLGSFVSAINSFSHSFNVIFNGSDISKTLDFENTYASIKFLRFGISYISGKISYRLPWIGESVDYNGWIIAPDTQTKNGKSLVHTTHTFTVAGNTNTEELYEENELGTTGQSIASIFEKQITTSKTVRGRLSSEIRLYNGVSYKELIVHVDIVYERLSSTGVFYAFGTVTCNTDLFEND